VKFSGLLLGRYVPRSGVRLQVQAYDLGRWQEVTTPVSDRRGRWRASFKLSDQTGHTVTYKLRVLVLGPAGLPLRARRVAHP
jgi:hypothetical protein